jgi:TATA-box binding protein (TBP) (component of TFIID and TFIIIB)
MFSQNYRHNNDDPLACMSYMERSNVVHHSSIRATARVFRARTALYRVCAPMNIRTARSLSRCNLEATKSTSSHYRIRSRKDGKFLVFGTGNIILAGRKSHASACLSSNRMIARLAKEMQAPLFTVSHQSPNSVVTGKLVHNVSAAIKHNNIDVNYSNKFPGIALNINTVGVTPELYLKRGMVILPGITSSAQLRAVVAEVATIIAPYQPDAKSAQNHI